MCQRGEDLQKQEYYLWYTLHISEKILSFSKDNFQIGAGISFGSFCGSSMVSLLEEYSIFYPEDDED